MLDLRPVAREEARAFVMAHHRHHGWPAGFLWLHAIQDDDGQAAEGDLLGEALKALAKCAEAPFSGWTIAQAIARDVLSRAGKLKGADHGRLGNLLRQ